MVFQDKVAPSVQQLGGDPAMPLDSMFVAGTGAMFQAGSSAKSLPTRVKDKFVVKDTLMPMGPGNNRGSMAGVDVMMINKQSKFQKESWELTKLLCDKETGIRLGEGRRRAGHRRQVARPVVLAILGQPVGAEPPPSRANSGSNETGSGGNSTRKLPFCVLAMAN